MDHKSPDVMRSLGTCVLPESSHGSSPGVDIQGLAVTHCWGRFVSRAGPPEPSHGSSSGWTSRAWLWPAVGEGPSAEPSVALYHKCTPRTSFSVPPIEEEGICTQRCHLKQGLKSSVSRSVKSLAGHLASISDKVKELLLCSIYKFPEEATVALRPQERSNPLL